MQRTQISLEAEERALLDDEAARTGKSMSALIREAVRVAYAPKDDASADIARFRLAFGAWDANRPEGEEYVESLRTGTRWKQLEE